MVTRVLRPASPLMRGADVTALQHLLHVSPTDGIYGAQTSTAVYRRKVELGYARPDHSSGGLLLEYLTGKKHPSAAMVKRAAANAGKVAPPGSSSTSPPGSLTHEQTVRLACVEIAHLLIANQSKLHYPFEDHRTTSGAHLIATRIQLLDALDQVGGLAIDCSQTVQVIAHVAGAKDPDGSYAANYAADGYTGTLLADPAGRITASQVQPGDIRVYGPGTGHHTAMAIEKGPNPLVVSHGSDPIKLILDSDEARYQPAGGAWLRLPI